MYAVHTAQQATAAPAAPSVDQADSAGLAQSPSSHPGRLERVIAAGLLVLVAVMPFHAFLSVWLGSLIGHQSLIQGWKEAVTLVLALLAGYRVWRRPDLRARLRTPLVWWTVGFVAIGLLVTAITRPPFIGVVYGLKTDYEFIVLLLVAMVAASRKLRQRAVTIAIITGTVVAAFGVIHSYLLPADILTHVGYGPLTVQAYQLVDPALSVIRSPSTLGGPNQLGAFLILPLSLVLARAMRRPRLWHAAVIATMLGGIWVSYSRAALLGAFVAVLIVVFARLSRRQAAVGAGIVLAGLGAGLATVVYASSVGHDLQYYVFHTKAGSTDTNNSTTQHALALVHSLDLVASRPLGEGLGTAGPASLRTSDKFISENYYLQVAIEIGVIGLAAFIGLLVTVALRLYRRRHAPEVIALLAALAGVSVVNLFLHGWADSTLAFVYWIVAGLWLMPLPGDATAPARQPKRRGNRLTGRDQVEAARA